MKTVYIPGMDFYPRPPKPYFIRRCELDGTEVVGHRVVFRSKTQREMRARIKKLRATAIYCWRHGQVTEICATCDCQHGLRAAGAPR